MIRCHLSTLMGRHKLKIADVSRHTGLNRSTITALYRESAVRVDIDAIGKLCRLFNCHVGDLFEYVGTATPAESTEDASRPMPSSAGHHPARRPGSGHPQR